MSSNSITVNQLAQLLDKPKRRTCLKAFQIELGPDGLTKQPLARSEVGGFEGKTGTMRRSRKGRTYHAPNGSRYYVPGSATIVAYVKSAS